MTHGGQLQRLRRWSWRGLFFSLALFGFSEIGSALYIQAGAPENNAPHKAWSWANTWPVVRLVFPQQNINLLLADGAGAAPASAAGRLPILARLGKPGTAIIAAHQGMGFPFLANLRTGDRFWIETKDGRRHHYAVVETTVLQTGDDIAGGAAARPSLVLLTCYPADTVSIGGALRYLVFAETPDRA